MFVFGRCFTFSKPFSTCRIDQSINRPISSSTNRSIHQPTAPSMTQPMNQPRTPSANQTIKQPTNKPTTTKQTNQPVKIRDGAVCVFMYICIPSHLFKVPLDLLQFSEAVEVVFPVLSQLVPLFLSWPKHLQNHHIRPSTYISIGTTSARLKRRFTTLSSFLYQAPHDQINTAGTTNTARPILR